MSEDDVGPGARLSPDPAAEIALEPGIEQEGRGWRRLLVDPTPLRRHRDFRVAFAARIVSFLGTMVTFVALPAQVYDLTGSSLAVGLLGVAEIVPLVGAALLGGAVADRADRRRVLVLTEAAFAVSTAALAWNATRGDDAALWLCYAFAALTALLDGFQRPALEAVHQAVVDLDEIPAANALRSLVTSVGMIVGPVLGGVLVSTWGFDGAFAFDTVTFLGGTLCLLALRGNHRAARRGGDEKGHAGALADVGEGLRYARSRPDLLGTYLVDIVAMVFGMPIALFPALAADFGGDSTLGLLYAAPAVGVLVTSLVGGVVTTTRRHGIGLLWAAASWGLAITVFGFVRSLPLALLLLACAGAADHMSGLFRLAIWNQTIPNDLRGRLAGIEMLSYSVGPTIGNVESGAVAALFSVRISVVSGGLLCTAGTAILAVTMPALRRYRAPRGDVRPGRAPAS